MAIFVDVQVIDQSWMLSNHLLMIKILLILKMLQSVLEYAPKPLAEVLGKSKPKMVFGTCQPLWMMLPKFWTAYPLDQATD